MHVIWYGYLRFYQCIEIMFLHLGSCYDVLQNSHPSGIGETASLIVLHGVLSALSYLHDSSIIHRYDLLQLFGPDFLTIFYYSGLSSHQLLIDSSYTVKLAGFQHAVSLLEGGIKRKTIFEMPALADQRLLFYYSPEMLAQRMQGYNTLADIYAVGILAVELATAKLLLADQHVVSMMFTKCVSGNFLGIAEKALTEHPSVNAQGSLSQSFIELVLSCLNPNWEDRYV